LTRLNKERTAFVTGGTGFVGSNLIAALIEQNWAVTALHRPSANVDDIRSFPITLVAGDVTDQPSLLRAMPENIDAVFHVAGDTNTWARYNDRQTLMNVGGTRNMVDVALKKGAKRFIHTSTSSAYGTHTTPLSEQSISVAKTSWINYELTKWLAEEEVRHAIQKGLDAVIINPCAILGPGDRRSWAGLFFQIRDGKLKALPPGVATFNHVHEVVKAHISAVDKGRRGENYLLTGAVAPLSEMISIMADLMNIHLKAKVAPPLALKLIGRVNAIVADVTGNQPDITPEMAALMCISNICNTNKAERELGYRPRPLQQCLSDSYDWLKFKGLL
jgi:dihydroflavonol-4-reductase